MSLQSISTALHSKKSWIFPLLVLLFLTPFTPWLDLATTNYFYAPGQGADGLGFTSSQLFTFLYKYGPLPALMLFVLSTIALGLSFFKESYKSWRKPALILFLSYGIGSGLITHAVLKDHWGRPRPKQTIEFGGNQPFRPYYFPNFTDQPQPSKSFPCGHCSTGFYFFAAAFAALRLNSSRLFWLSITLALVFGILLSLTRIVQGGHFFSDTVVSAIIMWLTPYGIDKWLYRRAES